MMTAILVISILNLAIGLAYIFQRDELKYENARLLRENKILEERGDLYFKRLIFHLKGQDKAPPIKN